MSVEGLLSEVSAILGSRLAVKAADQAFFGGKQVYTDVSASTSSSEMGGNYNGKGGATLQSAIKNAKQIVDKALARQASAGGSNEKVFAEIASLKKENQSIKDELAQLRKLVEQLSVSGVASKSGLIAKSAIIDVEPWDDKTDLKEMEDLVRSIQMDGLVWGRVKQIAMGDGIKKLQIITFVKDRKVVDVLVNKIADFGSHVQAVEVVAFNKI